MSFRVPVPPVKLSEPERFYASTVYKRIEKMVEEKTKELEENEELFITVPLLDGARIIARAFGYQNPGFLIVYGTDSETGLDTEAWLSHMSAHLIINVIKPVEEAPRRTIGFRGDWSTALASEGDHND